MKDTFAHPDDTRIDVQPIDVPWPDVLRSRADFPQARFSFHLDLFCNGLSGLGNLARVLGDSGLQLRSLRATQNGAVRCILIDDGATDLSHLSASLPQVATLLAWVTQIEFQHDAHSR